MVVGQSGGSLRSKRTQLLHGGFLLFNPAHLGVQRPLMQARGQAIQLIRCADRVDVHSSVVFIAGPAAQP